MPAQSTAARRKSAPITAAASKQSRSRTPKVLGEASGNTHPFSNTTGARGKRKSVASNDDGANDSGADEVETVLTRSAKLGTDLRAVNNPSRAGKGQRSTVSESDETLQPTKRQKLDEPQPMAESSLLLELTTDQVSRARNHSKWLDAINKKVEIIESKLDKVADVVDDANNNAEAAVANTIDIEEAVKSVDENMATGERLDELEEKIDRISKRLEDHRELWFLRNMALHRKLDDIVELLEETPKPATVHQHHYYPPPVWAQPQLPAPR